MGERRPGSEEKSSHGGRGDWGAENGAGSLGRRETQEHRQECLCHVTHVRRMCVDLVEAGNLR